MRLEGLCFSQMDPRPDHRAAWAHLASLTPRRAYHDSPFVLSGRGDSVARPNGLPFAPIERPTAPVEHVSPPDESGARPLAELRAESVRERPAGSNLLPLRRAKDRTRRRAAI